MQRPVRPLFCLPIGLLLVLLAGSCDPLFNYSPYDSSLAEEYHGTNAGNLKLIESLSTDDSQSFKVAVFSDPHFHYRDLEDLIRVLNNRTDYSFALVVGDLTENGLKQEFIYFHRIMSRLSIPYIAVIGNHDYLANGEVVYAQMFGPPNQTFNFNNTKFVIFDNTTLESNRRPDMEWLAEALVSDEDSYDYVIPVSHIPPYDGQMKDFRSEFHRLLRERNISVSLHGHRHEYSVEDVYSDGTSYVSVGSPQKRAYTELNVSPSGLTFQKIEY